MCLKKRICEGIKEQGRVVKAVGGGGGMVQRVSKIGGFGRTEGCFAFDGVRWGSDGYDGTQLCWGGRVKGGKGCPCAGIINGRERKAKKEGRKGGDVRCCAQVLLD